MIQVNETIQPNELLELVQKAENEGARIIIERKGKKKVAIINYAELEYLEALEDARDAELLSQAVAESQDQPAITFEELLDEYGLRIEDLNSEDQNE